MKSIYWHRIAIIVIASFLAIQEGYPMSVHPTIQDGREVLVEEDEFLDASIICHTANKENFYKLVEYSSSPNLNPNFYFYAVLNAFIFPGVKYLKICGYWKAVGWFCKHDLYLFYCNLKIEC